jgi:hypothetical protein
MTRDQLIETMARAMCKCPPLLVEHMPRAEAALTAIEAAGMRVVPVEPTEPMMEQYKRTFISSDRFDGPKVYRAMVLAAQEDSTSE